MYNSDPDHKLFYNPKKAILLTFLIISVIGLIFVDWGVGLLALGFLLICHSVSIWKGTKKGYVFFRLGNGMMGRPPTEQEKQHPKDIEKTQDRALNYACFWLVCGGYLFLLGFWEIL